MRKTKNGGGEKKMYGDQRQKKLKVNHRNTEQHTFSHSAVCNKYFINFLEYYAIVNKFLSLLVLKTPLFYVTKNVA